MIGDDSTASPSRRRPTSTGQMRSLRAGRRRRRPPPAGRAARRTRRRRGRAAGVRRRADCRSGDVAAVSSAGSQSACVVDPTRQPSSTGPGRSGRARSADGRRPARGAHQPADDVPVRRASSLDVLAAPGPSTATVAAAPSRSASASPATSTSCSTASSHGDPAGAVDAQLGRPARTRPGRGASTARAAPAGSGRARRAGRPRRARATHLGATSTALADPAAAQRRRRRARRTASAPGSSPPRRGTGRARSPRRARRRRPGGRAASGPVTARHLAGRRPAASRDVAPSVVRPRAALVAGERVEGVAVEPDPAAAGEVAVHQLAPDRDRQPVARLRVPRAPARPPNPVAPRVKTVPEKSSTSGTSPSSSAWRYFAAATSKS